VSVPRILPKTFRRSYVYSVTGCPPFFSILLKEELTKGIFDLYFDLRSQNRGTYAEVLTVSLRSGGVRLSGKKSAHYRHELLKYFQRNQSEYLRTKIREDVQELERALSG
jgi:hypothetical protein